MCISVNSPAARALARIFKTGVRKLDAMDGDKDGNIAIQPLTKGPFGKRIFAVEVPERAPDNDDHPWTCICVGHFIDDGDGKIGPGDLFVYSIEHPICGCPHVRDNSVVRFARLFQPRKVQRSDKPDEKSSMITKAEDYVLRRIEAQRGKSYNDKTVLKIRKCGRED